MKKFNTAAVCVPSKHYMVDVTDRVESISKMIDDGNYFTINRARQFGKTTTIAALQHKLAADYEVISISLRCHQK